MKKVVLPIAGTVVVDGKPIKFKELELELISGEAKTKYREIAMRFVPEQRTEAPCFAFSKKEIKILKRLYKGCKRWGDEPKPEVYLGRLWWADKGPLSDGCFYFFEVTSTGIVDFCLMLSFADTPKFIKEISKLIKDKHPE